MAEEASSERPPVNEQDKALAADWRKRIQAALDRPQVKTAHARFERNRKLLRGFDPDKSDAKMRTNLYFANIAALRPQVYAKDPEFAVQPTKAAPEQQLELIRKFCETAETLLQEMLVKRGRLKKRAKRLLTAAFATSVGWWKVGWQQDKRTDPIFQNQIKDTQDNLIRLEEQRKAIDDPQTGNDTDLKIAQMRETLAGLQAQAEVKVATGVLIDFVMSEDILVVDSSIRELGDYERAGAIAHRVWMGRDEYRSKFGYACTKGKSYSEIGGMSTGVGSLDSKLDLLCVWEIWDQSSNRIFHVCDGEEGFCDPPSTPDWTGERWYCFFGLAFNEIDGAFYPLSDIELTEPLVREYNESRDDFARDRKDSLPFTVVRKGGSLTPDDVKHIRNREGNDVIVVEGVGGQPIANDIQGVKLGDINPENYNTQPARQDIEQIIGGGDAARGSVLEAKTATEAEILSQGLRGRTAERQDTMEDLLSEVGAYALQMMLRKLSEADVKAIAGEDAVWPQLTAEEVFKLVTVEVRGGSTGKPDRLQEQDRWTKLLPVIEKALAQVAELRLNGAGEEQAQAIIALVKETLRRFDERLDIDQFLPTPKKGEEGQQAPPDPMQDPRIQEMVQQAQEVIQQLQEQVKQLEQQVADKAGDRELKLQQAQIDAEKTIEVAKVTAPIEAAAKVEAARITAEAQASAKVTADADRARVEAEAAALQAPPEPEGPSETDQIAERLESLSEGLQQMAEMMAQMQSAPKPRMKIVHDIDPKTNRIGQSRLVPDEDET